MPTRKFRTIKRKRARPSLKKTVKAIVSRAISRATEHKFFDDNANLSASDTWGWRQIFSPVRGTDDDSERVGDSVFPSHMELRLGIIGADTSNFVRVVIFRVKSGTSANAYFEYDASAYSYVSPYTHDRRTAIEVLFDKTYTTNSTGTNALTVTRVIKMAKKAITFLSGTTTPESNGLYMAYCSDSSAVSHPTLKFMARTHYTDA